MAPVSVFAAVLVVSAVVWLLGAILTAAWAGDNGYPAWPIFFASLFLGFPVPLLVVAVASAHRPQVTYLYEDDEKQAPVLPHVPHPA